MRRAIPVAIVRDMPPPPRITAALGLLLVGALALILFGTQVGSCLGPLGVTGIQCAQASGIFPTVGLGLPLFALGVAAAVVLVVPAVLEKAEHASAGALVGSLAGIFVYLVARPLTWTGPTSTGEVITVGLPVDTPAAATAAILGGLAGMIVMRFAAWAMWAYRDPRQPS